MSALFGRDKSVISRHLSHIFKTGELDRISVVAKNATTASDGKTYQVEYFNLDAIISIGYRINSKQGTQFSIWATNRLKEYLVQGFSINQKRLDELGQILQVVENANQIQPENQIDETKGLLHVLTHYAKSFVLLNKYDSNHLELPSLEDNITYEIHYDEAKKAIEKLKDRLINPKTGSI